MSHDFKLNDKVTSINNHLNSDLVGRIDYAAKNLVVVDWYGTEQRTPYQGIFIHDLRHWVKPLKFKVGDKVKTASGNVRTVIVIEKDIHYPYRLSNGGVYRDEELTLVVDTPAQKDLDRFSFTDDEGGGFWIKFASYGKISIGHLLTKEQTAKLREILGETSSD